MFEKSWLMVAVGVLIVVVIILSIVAIKRRRQRNGKQTVAQQSDGAIRKGSLDPKDEKYEKYIQDLKNPSADSPSEHDATHDAPAGEQPSDWREAPTGVGQTVEPTATVDGAPSEGDGHWQEAPPTTEAAEQIATPPVATATPHVSTTTEYLGQGKVYDLPFDPDDPASILGFIRAHSPDIGIPAHVRLCSPTKLRTYNMGAFARAWIQNKFDVVIAPDIMRSVVQLDTEQRHAQAA